jgi:hypothetical protein
MQGISYRQGTENIGVADDDHRTPNCSKRSIWSSIARQKLRKNVTLSGYTGIA